MASSTKILDQMRREPGNVRFADLRQVLLALDKLEGLHNER